MKKIYVFLFVIAIISSCKPEKSSTQFEKLSFIEGTWGNISDSTNKFFESWTRTNENTFSGKAFTLSGNDTISSEIVELKQQDGIIIYSPSVKDQNEGKSVPFKLTETEGDTVFWFTNHKHDFPTAIVYKKVSPDSIVTWIEGSVFGEFRREYFPMKKIK